MSAISDFNEIQSIRGGAPIEYLSFAPFSRVNYAIENARFELLPLVVIKLEPYINIRADVFGLDGINFILLRVKTNPILIVIGFQRKCYRKVVDDNGCGLVKAIIGFQYTAVGTIFGYFRRGATT